MNATEAVLVAFVLFVLRLAVPVLVTVIFAYGMNRLVDHWNANIEV